MARKLAFLLLIAGFALPAFAVKRITVEQLEQVLSAAHGKQDAKVAQQLSNLELTERLNAARLSRWERDLPGPESRRSLVVLADVSAFLDPPAAEIPATAAPDLAAQRKIMALAVDYASKTIHQLPNFLAKRDTIRFEETPAGQRFDATAIAYQPLHAVGRSSDTVLYRDNQEVLESRNANGKESEAQSRGLTTRGEFGPILSTVLIDAAKGKLTWSRWEQGANGPLAVFHYAIPVDKSHYRVEFCCISENGGDGVFRQFTGYHGEMAIDPADGTIRRLMVVADLKPADKIVRADILVEYGPVEIGGKTYICPVKSISISRAPTLATGTMDLREFVHDPAALEATRKSALQTLLNDVVLEQYHVFRADARVLVEHNTEEATKPAAPEFSNAGATDLAAAVEKQEAVSVADNHVAPAAAETAVSTPVPGPGLLVPEISVTETAGLPYASVAPKTIPEENGFTLRVTSRLVEVGVVALDKKGHPVTDLKAEDLEVYDNGRKQITRFFSRAVSESLEASTQAPEQHASSPDDIVYANRRENLTPSNGATRATEGSVTIVLIDASNLAWADLANV